jgi:ATP-dependent helicase YprA (DUF1998 family)
MKKRVRINQENKKKLKERLGNKNFERLMRKIRIYSHQTNALEAITEGNIKKVQSLINGEEEYIIEEKVLNTLINNLRKHLS